MTCTTSKERHTVSGPSKMFGWSLKFECPSAVVSVEGQAALTHREETMMIAYMPSQDVTMGMSIVLFTRTDGSKIVAEVRGAWKSNGGTRMFYSTSLGSFGEEYGVDVECIVPDDENIEEDDMNGLSYSEWLATFDVPIDQPDSLLY